MNSLRTRIFRVFAGLLSLAMCINFVLVYRSAYTHTRQQVESQLQGGWQVFRNEMDARRQSQTAIARLITQDFGLRSEIAGFAQQGNLESLNVVLDNFRRRSGADLSLAADPEGRVLESTDHRFMVRGDRFPLPEGGTAGHEALRVRDGRLYQTFPTPVYAPEPNLIGWFVLGYALDDAAARHLSSLTGLQISFVRQQRGAPEILASSLDGSARAMLPRLAQASAANGATVQDGDALLYVGRLPEAGGGEVRVILQRSLSEAMQGYRPLFWQLALMALVTLLLTVPGAFFVAGSVSRPLSALTRYVRQIGRGDYAAAPPRPVGGEVQVLFAEFDAMRQAISEREAQIAFAAYHDPLTGLPNRLRIQQVLQERIEAHPDAELTTLVLGLNHFKDINDTLGHVCGDRLLRQLADRLRAVCRSDDVVGRFSGDSFAIVLGGIERHDVLPVMLRYRQVLDSPFDIEGIALTINAAVGIAMYPEHAENPATLLQRTEIAMYVAKEKRLPSALFSNQQNRFSLLRLSLMSELPGAIARGELELHYQPKLEIRSRAVCGVECLVRWRHPVHGLIFPDDFIPLAEQTGNIRILTAWAIGAALTQCARWRGNGWPLTVAVNISSVDVQDQTLVGVVQDALARSGLTPEALWLEVTESAVMDDVDKAVDLLGNLRQLGIRLAIDDYGTGYSSMAQLKRLPVQEMKIDKSFVMGIRAHEDDAIIVRSTIELGHNMGLSLVAEGVENDEILEWLARNGCDIAQGYGIGKPMPAALFEAWYSGR